MAQRKSIAHGRRWVGGTGRPALYLKVGPPGLGLRPYHGPRGLTPPGGRIYTLTRHSRPPGTPPVLSSPFPLSFLACPFTSFHFTATSAPFISLKTPSFAFLSLFDLSFSCSLVSLQRPLHFRAMPLTCISFTFQSLLFPFSPLVRIASMHSIIRIIRDDAGSAGGVVQY